MPERLLSFIASAASRRESVILRRYPAAGKALAGLMREGYVEYASVETWSLRVTAKGRAELRRLRELAAMRGAA